MGKVVDLDGITSLNLNPDRVLQKAVGQLETVFIAGWDKDGDLYIKASIADGGELLWLLAKAQKRLLAVGDE